MKSIYRREFIRSLATAMAVGLGGAVSESCTAFRVVAGHNGSTNSSKALAVLAKNCHALRKSGVFNEMAEIYRKKGCTTDVLQDTLETLLVSKMFGELSKEERMEPAVQDRVRDSLPVMTDAFMGMATFLEKLDAGERNTVRRVLIDEPEVMTEFQKQFDLSAQEHGIPENRVKHFHSLLDQCCWRLKYQDPSTVIDECIALVDKGGMRYGMTPDLRRQLAMSGGLCKKSNHTNQKKGVIEYQQFASLETECDSSVATDALPISSSEIVHPGDHKTADSSGSDMSGNDISTYRTEYEHEYNKGLFDARLGGALMGIGVGAELIGWVGAGYTAFFNTQAIPALFVLFGCVGGALCFIVGLIVMIVGIWTIYNAKSWLKLKKNKQ